MPSAHAACVIVSSITSSSMAARIVLVFIFIVGFYYVAIDF
jgi:hypothetical protein